MTLPLVDQEALRDRYAAMRPGWVPSSQVFETLVASRIVASGCVLDLGCGRGGVLERLHANSGLAVGLDPDERSLREHRQAAIRLAAGRALALPLANATCAVVACSWVLEHLSAPGAALEEVARVLRPGGSFLFLTPNLRNPLVGMNRLAGGLQKTLVPALYRRDEADTYPVYYRANTVPSIDRIARRAGLVCRSVAVLGDPTYLAFSESLFKLGRLLESLTPGSMKVHLVGEYVRA